MTKQIILIFAVLCSVQVQANSRYTERDTVQHEFFHDATELFQPLQPVYLDGVVVPRTGSGNWFVSVTGGATAFLGTPLGCEDLFGRVKPSYNLAVGKWFTPAVGARIHPRKITIASMQTCYGTCLVIGIPDRSRHAGDLPHLSESD